MGILGDAIREVRDTLKFAHEECGGKDVVDELKDVLNALKGK